MNHLVLFVLSVIAMAFTSNACEFESEFIQPVYDRFHQFRTTKAFDPLDSKVPLTKYSNVDIGDGGKLLAMTMNGIYTMEEYKLDADNKLETKNGQYRDHHGTVLYYERDDNGQFSFNDIFKGKHFKSSLRSIDAELPSNFEEDYKKILIELNARRKKMFDYQKTLSKEDTERIHTFEFDQRGDGFYAEYYERDDLNVIIRTNTSTL